MVVLTGDMGRCLDCPVLAVIADRTTSRVCCCRNSDNVVIGKVQETDDRHPLSQRLDPEPSNRHERRRRMALLRRRK